MTHRPTLPQDDDQPWYAECLCEGADPECRMCGGRGRVRVLHIDPETVHPEDEEH